MTGWTGWTGWTRRRFLGGSAVAIGLPLLDSLRSPARADVRSTSMAFVAFYVPNGMHMPAWTPMTDGPGWELTPLLASLSDVRDQVDVITGLRNAPADLETAGHHAAGTAGFLTARRARRTETDVEVGASLDQLHAQATRHDTFVDALALGIDAGDRFGECDNGFSCAYSRNISWSDPHTPRSKLVDPRVAFDMLFGGFDPAATAAERDERRSRRRSILDTVADQAASLRGDLGSGDRHQLDGYLDAVRELERRVEADPPSCGDALRPEAPMDFVDHVELMTEIMVLALRCDATRAITFMLGNSASNRDYGFLGVTGGHHDLSHHAGNPDAIAALQTIGAWEVERFASLVRRLSEIEEGDGTVLDRTLLLFSSELSDGNGHSHDDLPVLLAGGAATGREIGRHVRTAGAPISELFVSTLQWLGHDVTEFGADGRQPLPRL